MGGKKFANRIIFFQLNENKVSQLEVENSNNQTWNKIEIFK